MAHSHQFLKHINSIDHHIQFTAKTPNTDGSIPFVDTLVSSGPNNLLLRTIYRKPTPTHQYLHCVFNTLTHRTQTVCATHSCCTRNRNTKRGLIRCPYPLWALKRLKIKCSHKYNTLQTHTNTSSNNTNNNNSNTQTLIWWYPLQRD